MTDVAVAERAALADLMAEVGPDAPTLCEGWSTRDLAAHLIVRERRVDASPGILIKSMAPYLARVQRRVAARPWPDVIATLRRRPWYVAPLDGVVNTIEYFVHHEDVRRAQPGWVARVLPPDVSASLWRRVRPQAKLVLRRTPAAVTVRAHGFGEVAAGKGGPEVVLAGEPQELLLFLLGRQEHATVELTGPENIVGRMRTARYGI